MYDCVWEFGMNEDLKHLEKEFRTRPPISCPSAWKNTFRNCALLIVPLRELTDKVLRVLTGKVQKASEIVWRGEKSFGNWQIDWKIGHGNKTKSSFGNWETWRSFRIDRPALGTRRRELTNVREIFFCMYHVWSVQSVFQLVKLTSLNKVIDSSAGLCG